MTNGATLLLVLSALTGLYVLPPWLTARRLAGPAGWPTALLVALTLGTGSQAVIGLFWSRAVGGHPGLEIGAYFAFWLFVSAAMTRLGLPRIPGTPPAGREGLLLALLLVVAVAVRSLHPLTHLALGQSDAYSHLNNLRDLMELGYLSNTVYPLGFSWIMALPALFLRLDPYHLSRFAGAFFGAMMVLALYVLLQRNAGGRTALAGTLLAAAFPGFNLLIKTGIGVFPNQYGIFLIPVILFFALESARAGLTFRHPATALTLFSLAALAATVPMLLFHLFWVLLLAAPLSLLTPGASRPPRKNIYALALLPALLLAALLALHLSRTSSGLLVDTLGNITAGSSTARELGRTHPVLALAADYFSLKRIGLGGPLLNLAGFILGFAYLAAAAAGIMAGNAFLRLVGIWGFLGVVHVMFGVMQFSAYQREGWSLLEATVCLASLAVGVIAALAVDRSWSPPLLYGLGITVVALAFLQPPGHPLLNSSAEEEIARLVRSLETEGFGLLDRYDAASPGGDCFETACPDAPGNWVVVTRRFNQMGLVRALVGRRPSFRHQEIHHATDLRRTFRPGRCYLVLLDRGDGQDVATSRALSSVSPALVQRFLKGRRNYLALNDRLENNVQRLADKGVAISREIAFSGNLRGLVVHESCAGDRDPSSFLDENKRI